MRDSRQGIIEYLQQLGVGRQELTQGIKQLQDWPESEYTVYWIMYGKQAIAITDMQSESGTRAITK